MYNNGPTVIAKQKRTKNIIRRYNYICLFLILQFTLCHPGQPYPPLRGHNHSFAIVLLLLITIIISDHCFGSTAKFQRHLVLTRESVGCRLHIFRCSPTQIWST